MCCEESRASNTLSTNIQPSNAKYDAVLPPAGDEAFKLEKLSFYPLTIVKEYDKIKIEYKNET